MEWQGKHSLYLQIDSIARTIKFQNESINSRVLEVGIPKGATKSQIEQINIETISFGELSEYY